MAQEMFVRKGELDYDYKHDILFFKTKDAKYKKSIELDNIVIDIDSKDTVSAIQILEASEFLRIPKIFLKNFTKWKFETKVEDKKIEIRLTFEMKVRNKIFERSPIIRDYSKEPLPNSMLRCVPA